MCDTSFIGLFRTFPSGKWQVVFPDLPGCVTEADTFEEAQAKAAEALADHLDEMIGPSPRPRSAAELVMDAQHDWTLCRQFIDAVMEAVRPAAREEGLAPIELVAARKTGWSDPSPDVS